MALPNHLVEAVTHQFFGSSWTSFFISADLDHSLPGAIIYVVWVSDVWDALKRPMTTAKKCVEEDFGANVFLNLCHVKPVTGSDQCITNIEEFLLRVFVADTTWYRKFLNLVGRQIPPLHEYFIVLLILHFDCCWNFVLQSTVDSDFSSVLLYLYLHLKSTFGVVV